MKRTIARRGLLGLSLAVCALGRHGEHRQRGEDPFHVVLPTTGDAAGYRDRAGPARMPRGASSRQFEKEL